MAELEFRWGWGRGGMPPRVVGGNVWSLDFFRV